MKAIVSCSPIGIFMYEYVIFQPDSHETFINRQLFNIELFLITVQSYFERQNREKEFTPNESFYFEGSVS